MATNFRNSAGTDLDDVFDLYVQGTKPGTTAYRTSDGADLNQRYAPLAYGSQAAVTGFRLSNGSDVNTLWAKKGTASYSLGFNGGSYYSSGARSASVRLSIEASGNWYIRGTSQTVETVLASGTWLPAGASAADYQVQFEADGSTAGAVSNEASSYVSAASTRTFTVTVFMVNNGPASSYANVICRLRNVASGAVSTTRCRFDADSTGI